MVKKKTKEKSSSKGNLEKTLRELDREGKTSGSGKISMFGSRIDYAYSAKTGVKFRKAKKKRR